MFKISKILIIASSLFLSACSFKGDLPVTEVTYKSDHESTKIQQEWWKDFKDENLNELIEAGFQNNNNLNIAFLNIQKAAAALGISQSDLFPVLNAQANSQRARSSGNTYTNAPVNYYNNLSLGAGLSYEVDLWGRVRNSVNASKAQLLASKYDYDAAKLSLAALIAKNYFSLMYLKEKEKILMDTIASYEATQKLRQRQFEAGQINQIVYFQATSEVESTKSNLIEHQNQIAKQNNALALLTGKSYDDILYKNFKSSKKRAILPAVPKGIPSDIILHRADVAAALNELKATNFLVGATKAEYFPTLSLTGSFGFQSDAMNNLFKSNSQTWGIGGSLIGPLLNFGKTKNRVESAKINEKIAFEKYDLSVKTALNEVRDSLDAREYYIKNMENLVKLNSTLEKTLNLATQRFNEGYTDYLEVLDANRQLLNARLSLAGVGLNLYNSIIDIYKALGGGFEVEETID